MQRAAIYLGLIILSLFVSALFFRLISGEDSWIPDGEGGWIKHGMPAGPPPDYPSTDTDTIPLVMWIGFVLLGGLLSWVSIYFYERICKSKQSSEI